VTRSRVPRPPPDLRNTVPVCLSSEETSPVAGEVAFWRGFIAWWAREHSEPVSDRAWAALERAESRQSPPGSQRDAANAVAAQVGH